MEGRKDLAHFLLVFYLTNSKSRIITLTKLVNDLKGHWPSIYKERVL